MGKKKEQKPISNKDINDIFKPIKKQNKQRVNNPDQVQNEQGNQEQKQKKSEKSKKTQNPQAAKNPQAKRFQNSKQEQSKTKYTEEGYKVYSTDDLKIGKGGNTNLCPFDCECCF
ncbi:unnamed protein product (macronuclear) [Paramecium tetraurelia]|uniref:DUF1764 domain-containing protein n=1 Tax=Paramecium tetraurelia TaxID=5888 RepID=A0BYY9_PARTE|nr:uncharacterized protein GSPATT00033609001 [Paramecium tetraurelia]CAK63756.1 unnamed protein product [Paramecium tetraurelia]|eukprot:XP_001431154.1 hypothetical protein (macronuclear) [Paramecium tetraurelia strain d4-2]